MQGVLAIRTDFATFFSGNKSKFLLQQRAFQRPLKFEILIYLRLLIWEFIKSNLSWEDNVVFQSGSDFPEIGTTKTPSPLQMRISSQG